ncbi:hypothetical protein cyc_02959 [Cyclospora cayetanensis]|uniref:tRNA (guanine(26)-N(2))-dimethyltransferase n=1 Tax=Cyclospora cayetanensis TaxID=88456 RepID=A0A1D3D217_9EIME|nr:hypothetical protein cyc_02959 [Cyclospora cayetanensis]
MAGGPEQAKAGDAGASAPSDLTVGYIREGLVKVEAPQEDAIFFNPAQVFNRDLSVLALKAFAEKQKELLQQRSAATMARCKAEGRMLPQALEFGGFNIVEPLAATGLRSLRYLKELGPIVRCAVVNDLDRQAAAAAEKNARINEIPENRFMATCAEGSRLLRLLSHPPLSMGTLKKINSLPAGAVVPASFDMTCPPEDLPLLPPLFKPTVAAAAKSDAAGVAMAETATELQGGVPLWYDVIDVDPYGSCSPFLDAAVGAVRSGGLLCVTSTDMCTLVGNSLETAFYKYGGAAAKMSAHHEVALRLVLQAVAQAAAKHRRAIQPLLCLSVDFYVRLFVRVVESPEQCKQLHQKESMVFHCPSCEAFTVAPLGTRMLKPARGKRAGVSRSGEVAQPPNHHHLPQTAAAGASEEENKAIHAEEQGGCSPNNTCNNFNDSAEGCTPESGRFKYRAAWVVEGVSPHCAECGGRILMGGPIYSGRYYDPEFVDLCLKELGNAKDTLPGLTMQARILGMLTALKEVRAFPANFQSTHRTLRRAALRRLGFKASHFHRDPQAIKTDAPAGVVFDLLRFHALQHPPADKESHPVLMKSIRTNGIDLSPPTAEENGVTAKQQVARWLPNPEPYWGPKGRAGKKRAGNDADMVPRKRQNNDASLASAVSVEGSGTQENCLKGNPLL